jgi:hypothetical protein
MKWVTTIWLALDFWALGVVAIFALFCVVLYRLHGATDNRFKFHDFFSSGDWPSKASVARLGYFGGFLVHSLVVLHMQMIRGGSSTELMSFYALIWSGAYVALKAIELRTPPQQPPGGTYGPQGNGAGSLPPSQGNQ